MSAPQTVTAAPQTYAQLAPPPAPSQDNSAMDNFAVILSVLLLIPIFLTVLALNNKKGISPTDAYYFVSIGVCALAAVLLLIAAFRKALRYLLYPTSAVLIICSVLPLLSAPMRDAQAVAIGKACLITTIVCALCIAFAAVYISVKSILHKYYSSTGYQLKCYQSLNQMTELMHSGVITAEQYNDIKAKLLQKLQ